LIDVIGKLSVVAALLTLVSCAALTRIGATGAGAAIGSLGGPGGAAAGAVGGLLLAQETVPGDPPAPETIWGLLSKLVDQAGWIAFVIALLWTLTWLAPSPIALFKRVAQRWRKPPG
jgi:hypothetical protein